MSAFRTWLTSRPSTPLQYAFYGTLYLTLPAAALALLFWLDQPYQLDDRYEIVNAEYVVSMDNTPPVSGWQPLTADGPSIRPPDFPFTSIWFRIANPLADELAAYYVPVPKSNIDLWYEGERIALTGDMQLPLPYLRSPLLVPLPPRTAAGPAYLHARMARDNLNPWGPATYIAPFADASRDFESQRFIMVLLPIGTLAIMSVFVVFMSAIFAFGQRESAYGWYALTLFFWGLHTAHALVDAIPFHHRFWFALNYLALVWIVCEIVFVNRFFALSAPKMERAMWTITAILATGLVGGSFAPRSSAFGELSVLVFVLWTFVCALLLTAQYFRALRRAWTYESVSLWLMSSVFIGVGVRDLLYEFAPGLPDPGTTYYLQYVALLPMLLFGWHLVRRFVTATRTAQLRNRELDALVDKRTSELEQSYKDIAAADRKRLLAEERARLMRDMHDGLGGQLVHALALSEQGGDDDLQDALRLALDDLRMIVDSLSPDQSGLDSLLASYRHRVSRLFKRTGTRVSWELEDFAENIPITPKQGLNILRILQEAVTNAVRHSKCEQIRILLNRSVTAVRLQVLDDGRGMQDTTHGRGLKNMRARAREIGAQLQIDSTPGGSCISFELPVAPPAATG